MGRKAQVLGGLTVVAVPLAIGIGDQLRMAAESANDLNVVAGDDLIGETTRQLASVDAQLELFQAASWLFYAAALLTIPALVTIWWLSVDRSPRWAWTGATLATIGVIGQTVHLTGYFGLMQVTSQWADLEQAARLHVALDSNVFVGAMFYIPFLLCSLGCWLPQAIGLRRSGVIPLWACLAVIAATVVMFTLGSGAWTGVLWTALMTAGLAPVALAIFRASRDAVRPESALVGA